MTKLYANPISALARRAMRTALAALFFVNAVVAAHSASSTTFYAVDPNAQKILTEMQAAYTSMNSLTEYILAEESPGVDHRLIVHTRLRLMRPGYVSMTNDSSSARSGSSAVVTDGAYCYVTAPQHPGRYLKFPEPATPDAIDKAASEGMLSSFTVNLFSNPSAVQTMFAGDNIATLQAAKSAEIDGYETDTIVVTDVNNVSITLSIDRTDRLVRRIVVYDPSKPGNFTETYTAIKVNSPLTHADFAFSPPPNWLPFYASSFDQAVQDSTNH